MALPTPGSVTSEGLEKCTNSPALTKNGHRMQEDLSLGLMPVCFHKGFILCPTTPETPGKSSVP